MTENSPNETLENKFYLVEALRVTQHLQLILVDVFAGQDVEYRFKVGIAIFSTLIADFVDTIIIDSAPEKKRSLVEQIITLAKFLIDTKEQTRQSRQEGIH